MIYFILKQLKQYNLIDWGVILYGWEGLPEYDRLLAEDIVDFTIQEIEKKEEYIPSALLELYSAGLLTRQEVTLYIKDMCEEEEVDLETSWKKWLVFILEAEINNLSDDYFENLWYLTDFWLAWGNPSYKPHIIQCHSEMTPYEYYTKENYKKFLKAHKLWIEEEKQKFYLK